jgi:hypothetical protein
LYRGGLNQNTNLIRTSNIVLRSLIVNASFAIFAIVN